MQEAGFAGIWIRRNKPEQMCVQTFYSEVTDGFVVLGKYQYIVY